LYKKL